LVGKKTEIGPVVSSITFHKPIFLFAQLCLCNICFYNIPTYDTSNLKSNYLNCSSDLDPEFLSQTLLALTNIAVLPDWHHQFHPLLPRLLQLWHSASNTIKFQSLRLLINLACNDETIPHLLAARCEGGLSLMLSRSTPEDQLLRSATLLANIYMSSSRQGLAEPGQQETLQEVLFGSKRGEIVREAGWLMENHQNYDIRLQARKIHVALEGIQHMDIK